MFLLRRNPQKYPSKNGVSLFIFGEVRTEIEETPQQYAEIPQQKHPQQKHLASEETPTKNCPNFRIYKFHLEFFPPVNILDIILISSLPRPHLVLITQHLGVSKQKPL